MLFTRRLRLFRKNKPFEKKLYLFHYWRYTYKMNSFRLEKCIPEIWRTLWDNECHWMHCLWSFASIVFIENAFFNIKLKATLKISRYFREKLTPTRPFAWKCERNIKLSYQFTLRILLCKVIFVWLLTFLGYWKIVLRRSY